MVCVQAHGVCAGNCHGVQAIVMVCVQADD